MYLKHFCLCVLQVDFPDFQMPFQKNVAEKLQGMEDE
jgi:hypothetical protein